MKPETATGSNANLQVARAELVLARPAHLPLEALPVRPDDPLQSLANALGDVRPDLGESVVVCLDLIPLTPARIRHHARQVAGESGTGYGAALFGAVAGFVTDLIGEFLPIARAAGARRTAMKSTQRVTNKFATNEPLFAVQVLIHCASEIPGRA
ncbi:hypothetical protein [Amycolatopsis sp. lyj-109]|uniref:hypothetical protein n=1 Tax=Amycolatopsis sp. lyj-109 TaxID=2789287 RepID=UPI003978D158